MACPAAVPSHVVPPSPPHMQLPCFFRHPPSVDCWCSFDFKSCSSLPPHRPEGWGYLLPGFLLWSHLRSFPRGMGSGQLGTMRLTSRDLPSPQVPRAISSKSYFLCLKKKLVLSRVRNARYAQENSRAYTTNQSHYLKSRRKAQLHGGFCFPIHKKGVVQIQ